MEKTAVPFGNDHPATPLAAAATTTPTTPLHTTRVLVGSDSPVLRAGLVALLRGHDSLEIVGAVQQLDRVPQHAAATAAEAALLAPTGGVATAVELLGDRTLPCRCVLLVPPATTRLFGAGSFRAQGMQCLPLTADAGRIVRALRRAPWGLDDGVTAETVTRGVGGRLTPREQEVVERLSRGETNALIARDLGVAEETVKAHLTSIYRKLGVPNRSAAIATYLGALS